MDENQILEALRSHYIYEGKQLTPAEIISMVKFLQLNYNKVPILCYITFNEESDDPNKEPNQVKFLTLIQIPYSFENFIELMNKNPDFTELDDMKSYEVFGTAEFMYPTYIILNTECNFCKDLGGK